MKRVVVLGLLALAACAEPPEVSGGPAGGIVTFGTRPVDATVYGRGANAAFVLAERHCAAHGRAARATGTDVFSGRLTFDCVPRP